MRKKYWFISAKDMRNVPINKRPPQPEAKEDNVDWIVDKILNEAIDRRKAGCSTMKCEVSWLQHPNPEFAGQEIAQILMALGYNIESQGVTRRDFNINDEETATGDVIEYSITFDWR